MKILVAWCIAIVALGFSVSLSAQAPANQSPAPYIVSLKAGETSESVAQEYGLTPKFSFRRAYHGFSGRISAELATRLRSDPRVAAVTPDQPIRLFDETLTGGQSESTQVVPAGVSRVGAAPGDVRFTGAGVGVAVLDTGLDYQHPDLQPLGTYSFWVPGYSDSAQDNNGHGTHVGGIIAARDNDRDVVGVAPRAVLYAVKVLDENGWGYDSDIIAGLEWVLVNGAQLNPPIRVANLSLGRLRCEDDSALHAAVARVVDSGVVVVAAAGNDATKDVRDMVPAGFPEVIAVASATASSGTSSRLYGSIRADTASSFTTDGAMDEYGVGVAISAPGEEREDIDHRGWINSIGILSTKLGGGTTRMSGTSMAAPHVAGVVALLFEQNPNLLPLAAKIKIMNGTLAMAAPYDSRSTRGYPVPSYSFDGDREGILSARNALHGPDGVSAEP